MWRRTALVFHPETAVVEVHEPGDVYRRDEFVYWGFPKEGLRRVAGLAGFNTVDILDTPQIDGHPRIVARLLAQHSGSSDLATGAG